MKRLSLLLACLFVGGQFAWADLTTSYYTTITKNENTTEAQTDNELWDPATDYSIVLQGCTLSADAAQTVLFEVGAAAKLGPYYLDADGSSTVNLGGSVPVWIGATDETLTYTTTTAANTTITCVGYEYKR